MKIKTITCQHVYNYGATLQAFALQSYLETCKHQVEIIDYRRPGHTRYELFAPIYEDCKAARLIKKYPFFYYILTPLRNARQFKMWGRKYAFDRFDCNYLHLTHQTYHSIEDLQSASIEADILIAGSDQIWNTDMGNGTDRCYYLDFGSTNVKRISYAASFGISRLPETKVAFVKEQLQRFDAISVREKSGVNILYEQLGLKGIHVNDPVFLLSREEWINHLRLSDEHKNFIFIYDFTHNDPRVSSLARQLAKKKNMKIVAVNDAEKTPYADIQVNNAGPKEFLQYLLSASYVISTSFHATAFALIFQKKFATFPLIGQRNPSRITNLLDNVGLINHFAPDNDKLFDLDIEWGRVTSQLNIMIDNSKKYLLETIK